jgi:hypothetical protein
MYLWQENLTNCRVNFSYIPFQSYEKCIVNSKECNNMIVTNVSLWSLSRIIWRYNFVRKSSLMWCKLCVLLPSRYCRMLIPSIVTSLPHRKKNNHHSFLPKSLKVVPLIVTLLNSHENFFRCEDVEKILNKFAIQMYAKIKVCWSYR